MTDSHAKFVPARLSFGFFPSPLLALTCRGQISVAMRLWCPRVYDAVEVV